ncbi:MAG: hypothetical protein IKN46_03095, partial [Acholeplasmatales bacterium]|nr:hypothetical protein [Acholeplasmatales bacterium]
MIPVIIIAALSVILMIVAILKFPTLKIKGFQTDTFFIPILIGAIILLVFPLFDKTDFIKILTTNSNLNPIKILILFICVSMMSIALDEAGFFSFIAYKFIVKFKSSQFKLFIALYFLISLLTIFTSNDIVILTLTPFICFLCKNIKVNPIPYLIGEFMAANTYSMMLIIGNPTNIYLATSYNIDFISYLQVMALPTVI